MLARDNFNKLAIAFEIIYIIAISVPQTKIVIIIGKLELKNISKITYGLFFLNFLKIIVYYHTIV